MLRGPRNSLHQKYTDVSNAIAKNLDCWLCNMYFEVQPLVRYIDHQRQFEVQMKFFNMRAALERNDAPAARDADATQGAGMENNESKVDKNGEESRLIRPSLRSDTSNVAPSGTVIDVKVTI